jgi:hypothetical protein
MSFKLEMCSDLETGEKGRNNHKNPWEDALVVEG